MTTPRMHDEVQTTFGNKTLPLPGMLYRPAAPPRAAVLLCHPLFEERKSAARVMVQAARSLAENGYLACTFDYRGTADAPGHFRDYSLPHWDEDIQAVHADVQSLYPSLPVALLGLRAGATLAIRAATRLKNLQRLVLWEPVIRGRDYLEQELRKKLMKEMITFGRSRESRGALFAALDAGREIDFDGYPITPALYRDLAATDAATFPSPPWPPTLVLHVAGQAAPPPALADLHKALRTAGARVDFHTIEELPFWNLIETIDGDPVIRDTVAWLKAAPSP